MVETKGITREFGESNTEKGRERERAVDTALREWSSESVYRWW